MAENPFMSAYLSAANRVAKTARGKATNEARIETAGDKHDQRLAGVPLCQSRDLFDDDLVSCAGDSLQ